jgi:hypothetical protein
MFNDEVPSGCSSLEQIGPPAQTKLFYVSSVDNQFVLNICSNDITTSNKINVENSDVPKKVQNVDSGPVWVKR